MLHLICNPASGSGRAGRRLAELEGALKSRDVAYDIHLTHMHGDAARIARELTGDDAARDIVAIGGDGTLHEVLNGVRDPSRVRLGIIPLGSGNDFAAAAGIPEDPIRALEVILSGEAKPTDYLICSGIRGINAIGTGIDVDILRRYARMKLLKGSAAYLASLVITLFSYKPYTFDEVLPDGSLRHHSAFIACAGNGVCFGGGIPICPKAVIDDGLMDVVIVDNIARPAIPNAFVQLMKRRVLELKATHFAQQQSLTLRSTSRMPIQIDGEIYEDLPFDVHIVRGGLGMFRP
ncbi:MAG: diacylglycerol kinase family lipid kinase [Clostridia bacterium]|nr:diacylglycerol kinase family lipid kinase [Clostridia bacterium]